MLNNKIYIGKTLRTVEERWNEHCKEYLKPRNEKRPLYAAMRKYGVKNFKIEILEEVSDAVVNDRETYWIEILGSFKYGYNATLGGDGKHYADYDLIFQLFQDGKNNLEIQNMTGYDAHTIRVALENRGISKQERQKRGRETIEQSVIMVDKDTNQDLKIFSSVSQAYKFLNKQSSGHIASVANGKRKTAYGYKWRYLN